MKNLFNVGDIVDIGIEKEKARQQFYSQVSDAFDNPELKDLFSKLSMWESVHVKKFEEVRASLKGATPTESYPGELTSYVQALVDDKLYKSVEPVSFAKTIQSPLDAIEMGIGFEKDAILLFLELSQYVRTKNNDVLQQLLAEERQHIVALVKMKKQVSSNET